MKWVFYFLVVGGIFFIVVQSIFLSGDSQLETRQTKEQFSPITIKTVDRSYVEPGLTKDEANAQQMRILRATKNQLIDSSYFNKRVFSIRIKDSQAVQILMDSEFEESEGSTVVTTERTITVGKEDVFDAAAGVARKFCRGLIENKTNRGRKFPSGDIQIIIYSENFKTIFGGRLCQ